jgi:hypothetical protein
VSRWGLVFYGDCPIRDGLRNAFPVCKGAKQTLGWIMPQQKMSFMVTPSPMGFRLKEAGVVEGYRDFREVFERRMLPKSGNKYASYQLIRNVLATHALGLSFCVLLDARRPDLAASSPIS